jgi:hypothetical protein
MSLEPLQIAFITGRSAPARCALSPAQSGFLAHLAAPGRILVGHNFPYAHESAPYLPVPLILACIQNAREYLGAQRSGFRSRYRQQVIALLEQAPQTLFLAGSCGLELLNRLALPAGWLTRVSVFAYGPVAHHRPACRHRIVQARGDWISGRWFSQADEYVPGGHLHYLSRPEVLACCESFIHVIETASDVPP